MQLTLDRRQVAVLVETAAGDRHPRPHLPLPGGDLEGVFTLRGIDDTKQIGGALEKASQSVAIIGGGYIGMEFAAVARSMGKTGHRHRGAGS
jgi:NADPH-dependent 2,4-dienoyl-CoA reductase/sulfur reductase-like enzyme